jgi:signal transduction histidine kinase
MSSLEFRASARKYRFIVERFLYAHDALTREEALFAAGELGREMLSAGFEKDAMLEMHGRTQRSVVARLHHGESAADRSAYRRLANGDARAISFELLTAHDFQDRAEQALRWRAENLRHQSVLDALEAEVVMLDSEGRITGFNHAWREFAVAHGNPELHGCDIGDDYIAASSADPELALGLKQVLAGNGGFDFRYQFPVELDRRWFLLRAQPLPVPEGGALIMHLDITRQVLLDERLRAADKLAAITTQAAGAAHDFNNLLGSIVGLTELCALEAKEESRQAGNLAKILRAAQKAAGLTRAMLDFSRQTPVNLQPHKTGAFLENCRSLWAAVVPESVHIAVRVHADVDVLMDASMLEQVFLNLASNAAHAMLPEGGILNFEVSHDQPRAELLAFSSPGAPRFVRISVRDTGTGIAPEILPSIFDPFFTTKAVGAGTGLGLAAAQGIVRAHGGLMDVESTVGVGTTFHVYLPVCKVAAQRASGCAQTVSVDVHASAVGLGLRDMLGASAQAPWHSTQTGPSVTSVAKA